MTRLLLPLLEPGTQVETENQKTSLDPKETKTSLDRKSENKSIPKIKNKSRPNIDKSSLNQK